MKARLINLVQEVFRVGDVTFNINKTFLVLIPKKEGATNFTNFRPISLCNFTYKVVAKILTLRIGDVITKIISHHQGAFVKGWWIAETTIVAQKVLHKVRTHKGKNGLMLLKINLKKAYDRVEWSFLRRALEIWGFFGCSNKTIDELCQYSPIQSLHQ